MNISHDLFYRQGRVLSLHYEVCEHSEHALISIIEEDKTYDLYCCDYIIQDVRFVQNQTTDEIMITWLAWTDRRRMDSRTYLLSLNESFVVQRVDLLKTTYIGREKNIFPTAVQFENVLLLGQINLVEGRVSLSLHDIETLDITLPMTLIQESISYDFYHRPESCLEKFRVAKVDTNEAAIMFYDEFDERCIYTCRINNV
ncbi:hypothetical protein [Pseudescherichia vulneris]|uniref:hypothetical protein n=1 Tax=Pseudescherichia vulneris TaxID=566 RepID=UPI003015DE1C